MQDKERHKIDDIFKNGLEQIVEETPPISGWDNLKKQIIYEGINFKKPKKYVKFLQLSIASSVLIITGVLSYFYINDRSNESNTAASLVSEKLNSNEKETVTNKSEKL